MEEAFDLPADEAVPGDKRKIIQPTCLNDPKLNNLKEVLLDWINATLKAEHIVVKSLEEDLFDGLVLHHLLGTLASEFLPVEEIAVTTVAQIRKLGVILVALNSKLGVSDETAKWSVALIHSKDLLATLHLLVSMVKCFQPDMALPPNVSVEVISVEVNRAGIKSDKLFEHITEGQSGSDKDSVGGKDSEKEDLIDQLMLLEPHKISAFKQAILHFVNKNMLPLGLQVTEMEKQFADGVILLLLIGQLEGFFLPLSEFTLSPSCDPEMLHNVTLALEMLSDRDIEVDDVDPQDIVSHDVKATLRVLYALFKKHKSK
ncbi:gamma-parvin [Clupea harengus]|uniref:Gamma-parvin n=1 Tax=Clupea harengus TaxID=7950 RepID=A0A6P8FA96_CLUHA|nr:gamma-parvin [Clupea harengus]XP_031420832.1 gamma-parvin [Clupea harengus]